MECVARSSDCLIGMKICFSCGKRGHKLRDFPNLNGQNKGSGKTSGLNEALKKNHFYALRSRVKQETSPNVVTSMLKVFSIDVYSLIDPDATLSYDTPLVDKNFGIFPNI